MLRVKICGITQPEDAQLASRLGADALGFIFYPQSKRYVTPERAARLMAKLPPFVTKVGVFVNHPLEEVNRLVMELGLDIIQLHGEETPDYCEGVQTSVIKAFRVQQDSFGPRMLRHYRCTAYLLDTYHSECYGGTGKAFDWNLARSAREYGPVILSGGLTAETLTQAVETVQPEAVDVCSGVESAPGRKDVNKLRAFLAAAQKLRPGDVYV